MNKHIMNLLKLILNIIIKYPIILIINIYFIIININYLLVYRIRCD